MQENKESGRVIWVIIKAIVLGLLIACAVIVLIITIILEYTARFFNTALYPVVFRRPYPTKLFS